MADPFFLLTLTGSAIGVSLYLAFHTPRRTAYPLRARRWRVVGIPMFLTLAVVTAGAAMLIDGARALEWWRWAAALWAGALVYTWVVLRTPRWWRVPLVLLLAVPIVPAVEAWRALPHPADYLKLSCPNPGLALRANGDSQDGDPTIALVRLDPPVAGSGPMALRVLPAVAIAADGAEGGWQPAVQVGADDRIRIVLTLTRYPPPLWWFPGSDQVSQLSIVAPEERATLHAAAPRAATLRAVTLRITRLSEVVTTREVELIYPHQPERFLQPGVYALEYSCAVTDTNNV